MRIDIHSPSPSPVQNGEDQRLQFAEGDTLLFDFSKRMPVYDADGKPVEEVNTVMQKNKITGLMEEKEVVKPVLKSRKFCSGVITADGPLAPLIGWAIGQKQFLMQRGQWPAGGLKHKCGAKAKDHTGTCCSTGLMYQQPDFQASTSKLEEIIRAAGHVCLFLPRCVLINSCINKCCFVSYIHCII